VKKGKDPDVRFWPVLYTKGTCDHGRDQELKKVIYERSEEKVAESLKNCIRGLSESLGG